MANLSLHETKERLARFVELWEPKFSLIAGSLILIAFFLGRIGSEREHLTEGAAEIIDRICLVAAATVGLLQVLAWLARWRRPPVYSDPSGDLPRLDEIEKGSLVLDSESLFGFPKARFFFASNEELELFVEWSQQDPAIAQESSLKPHERRLLYESWRSIDPRFFLIMEQKATVGASWDPVAISIILALPYQTIQRIKTKQMAIVDLRAEHLRFPADERVGCYLLYDTLIFKPQFRETYSDFKRWHSLIHFAQFEAPKPDAEVTIFIEPDNPILKISLQRQRKYGEHSTFKTVGNHLMHEFVLPQRGFVPARVAKFESHWRKLRSLHWNVPIGRS